MSNKSIAQLLNKLPETFTCLTIKNMPLMNLPTPCRRRNVTSAVKQRRRNHPGDLPFFVVAALDANYAAKSKFHDFIFFAACDEEGDEFAEKREVADDHQVAAGLFERFFRCCDLVLGAKAFALYQTIPRADRPREQFRGLLRARFVTVPNGIDRKLQWTQKIGNVLHFADSFVCQSPLRIFFFGFRFSVLNQIDAHDRRAPFAPNASFTFAYCTPYARRPAKDTPSYRVLDLDAG